MFMFMYMKFRNDWTFTGRYLQSLMSVVLMDPNLSSNFPGSKISTYTKKIGYLKNKIWMTDEDTYSILYRSYCCLQNTHSIFIQCLQKRKFASHHLLTPKVKFAYSLLSNVHKAWNLGRWSVIVHNIVEVG